MISEHDQEVVNKTATHISFFCLLLTLFIFGGFKLVLLSILAFYGSAFCVGLIGGAAIQLRNYFQVD